MTTSLDAAIDESLHKAALSTGDDLLGFEIDFINSLKRAGKFTKITTTRTDNSRCKLIISGRTSDHSMGMMEVGSLIERIWLRDIRYEDFEAHQISYEEDRVNLCFVTRNENSLCVTGKVIISTS